MRETQNIGLYLEDDAATKFKVWREKMNGIDNSNMIKIDNAFGEKADHSRMISTTLLSSAWVGESAPYTQELTIESMGADQNGTIFVANDASTQENTAASMANITVSNQEENTLTVMANGIKPEIDIPVTVFLWD